MRSRWLVCLAVAVAAAAALPAAAQSSTTGSLEGVVTNGNGRPVPAAVVTALANRAPVSITTDAEGRFLIPNLVPGTYTVRAEAEGYGAVAQQGVQVSIGDRRRVDFVLQAGIVEEVSVVAEAPLVDAKSTTIGGTFKVDEYADAIPVGRNFSDSFQLAPGVVSGGGTGSGNYSISGSSGLENQYIVDGVNITNTGYGGIGSYNIIYGSLGTGVTTDFLEEIQVKTGGVDAEYGGATGGVVNTVVKSGTNTLSGNVSAYITPTGGYGGFRTTSLSTGATNIVEREQTDLAASLGGPILKDKLFYFLAYNPVESTARGTVQRLQLPAGAGVPTFPAADLGKQEQKRTSDNWAAKLSWYLNPNHRIEVSGFGDPSTGDAGPQNFSALRYIDYPDGGGQSEIRYGANNFSVKYDAVFGPRFFMQFQASRHDGKFEESSLVDKPSVRDRRQQLAFLFPKIFGGAFPGFDGSNGATWFFGGTGFISNSTDRNDTYKASATWVLGSHELKGGVEYADIEYTEDQTFTGAPIDFLFPVDENRDGVYSSAADCATAAAGEDCAITLTSTSGASIDLRGDTDFRVVRAAFYPTPPPTTSKETSLYLQDTWSITPRWTAKLGLRATRDDVAGTGGYSLPIQNATFDIPNPDDPGGTIAVTRRILGTSSYSGASYTFDWVYAPHVGVTWDVGGDGRTKTYLNYSRYFERIPNDLAVRLLSNQVGLSRYRFQAYDFETGTPLNPRVLDNPADTINLQGLDTSRVQDGTKLPYVDEVVLGYQQELGDDLSVEVRGIYREQGRALEDVQFNTIESIQNLYYGQASGYYPAGIDPFPGFGAAPFGNYVLANPGENTPSGIPKAVRKYSAMEIVLDKRFSDHWLFYGNLRFSRLKGNYEGLFRNDNAQSDPNITSLFDFPRSPLTAGQFGEGVLNNDRPVVMNLYGSYRWDNGVTVGAALRWASGNPRTPLLAHPIYINSGELPGTNPVYGWWTLDTGDNPLVDPGVTPCGPLQTDPDTSLCWVTGSAGAFGNDENLWSVLPILVGYDNVGRGATGRNADVASLDLHIAYDHSFGSHADFRIAAGVFNVFDSREVLNLNDAVEATAGIINPDYNRPVNNLNGSGAYQEPRSFRVTAKWSF